MIDTSIFPDKSIIPNEQDLADKLGPTFQLWVHLRDFVTEKYPGLTEEWNYPGKKYGWNFRIKDKKRAIIYFLPRNMYFNVAFVFGQKATDIIMGSDISEEIKTELANATKYAEGRGIRIEIKSNKIIPDIKKLVKMKLIKL
jgi:hypothetical protein